RGADVPLETGAMDVRPGGAWHATMFFGADRRVIRWRGEYLEVVAPERLVLSFSQRPDEVYELVTVVLSDLGPRRTEMLLEQRGHMRPEEYERTRDGWTGFFDLLEARLRAADTESV